MAGVAAGALNPPIGLVLGVSSALYVLYRYREVGPRDVPVEVVTYALPEAATVSEVSEHPGRLESPDVNCPAGSID